ncbi:hypothetical protein C8N35_111119 [Breoghania corrubedonensis]|uniref:Uncharacterized protein n=1 Tax=Breoghania corrubedonensis TaxID=665038 RepID=A0A2T5UYS6_9HYPH|nr:hypothetical protein [Breoghania corrubedonensis]PTW56656.1 hypothetical protein C8N35_111119 [Breoghania corrubedonensis]
MRNSAFVVLSDLVASTLGIAVLLFLLAIAGGPKSGGPLANDISAHSLEASFKTYDSPPLSPQDVVAALYARTWGSGHAATVIDVFSDRIVLVRHSSEKFDPGTEIPRKGLNRGDLPPGVLSGHSEKLPGPIVFNFSNEMLNVLGRNGSFPAKKALVISVPRALYRVGPNGRTSWSPGFSDLIGSRSNYQLFRKRLEGLLADVPSSSRLHVNEDGRLARGAHFSFHTGRALSRIPEVIEKLIIIILYGMSALIVLRVERNR